MNFRDQAFIKSVILASLMKNQQKATYHQKCCIGKRTKIFIKVLQIQRPGEEEWSQGYRQPIIASWLTKAYLAKERAKWLAFLLT